MDVKKLESLIKKTEKKRANQLKRVETAEAKAEAERKTLEEIDEELKPMYSLRKKLARFEKNFNASVAELASDEEEKEQEEPQVEQPASTTTIYF